MYKNIFLTTVFLCLCILSCSNHVSSNSEGISIAPTVVFKAGNTQISPDSVATIAVIIRYGDIDIRTTFDFSDHSGTLPADLPKNTPITVRIEGLDKNNNVIYFGEQLMNGANSDTTLTITANQVTPVAPSDFSVHYLGDSKLQFAWTDNSSNESGFIIFISTSRDTVYRILDTIINVQELIINTNDITNGVVYYYKIAAFNNAGKSDSSLTSYDPMETIEKPATPRGDHIVFVNGLYIYETTEYTCGNGHALEYRFDWGVAGNEPTAWSKSADAVGSWKNTNTYNIRIQTRCSEFPSILSEWSDSLAVTVEIRD